MLEALVEVADFPQLLFYPAVLDSSLEVAQGCCRRVPLFESFEGCFRREHAALDGEMNSFEPLRIQKSGGVTQDHPAVSGNRRDRPPPTVRKRLGAVTNHLAALEQIGDEGMFFEFLQNAL